MIEIVAAQSDEVLEYMITLSQEYVSWMLAEMMTFSAISFVIGHELGHILHDHTTYTDDRDANHTMEFKADQLGLSIAIRHSLFKSYALKQDNYFTKFGLFGPLFALAVMSLFGDSSSETHPSLKQRRDKLLASYWSVFSSIFADKSQQVWSGIDESLQDILEYNTENLFQIIEMLYGVIRDVNHEVRAHDVSWLTGDAAFISR